jgi:hypothetical protein
MQARHGFDNALQGACGGTAISSCVRWFCGSFFDNTKFDNTRHHLPGRDRQALPIAFSQEQPQSVQCW